MSRIVVTGLGVVSAVGHDVAENRSSLMQGKSGIGPLQLFRSKFSDHILVGEVSLSDAALKEKLAVRDAGVTRTSLLALQAFNEAIADSGLTTEQLSSKDTALIGASTVGGICLTDELYMDAQQDTPASEFLNSYDFAVTSFYLQKLFRIGGPVNTIHTACSSSANAIMYGARLLKSGRARRAIVGGFDGLAKFTINGFNALHILSSQHCMPFDEARNGLNLGEGAGFLVLEKEEDACAKKIYASVSGYANTNDAFHASSLSDNGDGPYKAMADALVAAKLNASQIDFVNAHGTGTENNDKVESVAMQRVFDKVPAFASTKANTGHTLGAAAAIEAVYCVLNLYHQEIYPGLRFQTPIAANGLVPVRCTKKNPWNM